MTELGKALAIVRRTLAVEIWLPTFGCRVGRTGLEPVTPCASCKCATNCANGPGEEATTGPASQGQASTAGPRASVVDGGQRTRSLVEPLGPEASTER